MGESCSRPARVSRGSVEYEYEQNHTYTANSHELGSRRASDPPEGRAAATSGAEPPLQDFPEGEASGERATTGDVGAECRTPGLTSWTGSSQISRERSNMMTFQGGGQRSRCGLRHRLWTSNRWEPGRANRRGRRDARRAHNGLTSPSEARSDGASDHNFKSAPARSNWSTTASAGGDHQLTKSCSCRGAATLSFSHPSRLGVRVRFIYLLCLSCFSLSESLRGNTSKKL